jgi:hypothetical protein
MFFLTPSSRRALTVAALLISGGLLAEGSADAQQVPPEMRAQAQALMQVCRGDYNRLCNGVQPGGGRILACLEGNAGQLSPACKQAMPQAQSLKEKAAAAGYLPK